MNIDDYLRKSSNHRVFGRRHKKTRNVAIAYYFMNVLESPPSKGIGGQIWNNQPFNKRIQNTEKEETTSDECFKRSM